MVTISVVAEPIAGAIHRRRAPGKRTLNRLITPTVSTTPAMTTRNAVGWNSCSRNTPTGTGGNPATMNAHVSRNRRCRHVCATVNPVVRMIIAVAITTASCGSSINSRNGIATVPRPKLMVPSTIAPKNIATNPSANSHPINIARHHSNWPGG